MKLRWPFRADEIVVGVHPDRFHFRSPRLAFELPAIVGADDRADSIPRPDDALFRPSLHPEALPSPRALAAYLKRALLRCVDGRVLMLKPHLVFRGAASLDPLLSGFQYDILRRAAFQAGAQTVRFEPSGGEIIPAEYTHRAEPKSAPR